MADKIGRITFSFKMVCFLSILAFYFTLIVQAKQDSTINGMNLQIFSFYITLRMQTSKQTSLFKKSVSKYPGIWGTLLQILSSRALCNISFHCAHDKMTLREKWKSVQEEDLKAYDRQKKIGNRINFSLFCPACRDTSILIPLVR